MKNDLTSELEYFKKYIKKKRGMSNQFSPILHDSNNLALKL